MRGNMTQKRVSALLVLLIGAGMAWFVFSSQTHSWRPFKLGLDLSGGTQLVYRAELQNIAGGDVSESMSALRDVIERRVNLFGVSEPLVQTQHAGALTGQSEERLLVELPGITDTQKAIQLIGQTPVLEFRMLKAGADLSKASATSSTNDFFEVAAITGKDLKSAELQFQGPNGIASQAVVVLHFNSQGAKMFADLTKKNVGRVFGIFLD